MHKLAIAMLVLLLAAGTAALSACSTDSDDNKEDHVFKAQERALNKAKQLQQQLDDASDARKKQIDEAQR